MYAYRLKSKEDTYLNIQITHIYSCVLVSILCMLANKIGSNTSSDAPASY